MKRSNKTYYKKNKTKLLSLSFGPSSDRSALLSPRRNKSVQLYNICLNARMTLNVSIISLAKGIFIYSNVNKLSVKSSLQCVLD